MRKPVQIIGTSLAAVAIVGGTSAVASADPGFGHHGFGHHQSSHGFGHGFAQYGFGQYGFGQYGDHRSVDPQQWVRTGRHDATPSVKPSAKAPATFTAAHPSVRPQHVTKPADDSATDPTQTPIVHHARHHHATFAQRKAAIVAGLTAADDRLTALQSRLTTAANDDPTGRAAQALTWVTQAKQRVESLLSQVQAATTQQELNAVLAQYFNPSGTAPTPTPSAPSTDASSTPSA